jgi:hypothetical protein
MAQSITNSIRIIPRDENFLNRIVGASGEIFFNRDENTLRLYDGNNRGGFTVVSDANISTMMGANGVASLEYDVTIQAGQGEPGNVYVLNNEYKPELQLVIGYTYVFNQSDQTNEYYPNPEFGANNQHPINFSADDPNGELGSGTVYETNVKYQLDGKEVTKEVFNGVKFAAATERKVFLLVTKDTPSTLYYYCSRHQNMGNTIAVVEPGAGSSDEAASISVGETAPEEAIEGNIWFNETTGKLYVYVTDENSSQWVQPSYPLPPAPELDWANIQNTPTTLDGYGITDGGGSSFDQDLNTTDDVTFAALTVQGLTDTGLGTTIVNSATTLTLQASDGVIVTGGPFRLPSFDNAGRDALVAEAGDMIYNTDNNRPEMYNGTAWRIVTTEPIV